MAEMMFQPIAVMFGGHLGKVELDAIGLSNMLIGVLGTSIIMGMASSCETVFSQSYGYGDFKMVGVYLQRALAIHLLALLPCFAIHLNIESLLVALHQDQKVARLAGQYLLYFMPAMIANTVTFVVRRYTQCQGNVTSHLIIMLTGHVLNAVCQYLCLYKFNLGIVGSVMALDITFMYIVIVTIAYTLCTKEHRQAWGGWSTKGLEEWGPLAMLAVFGMFMVCFEWWAFEVGTLIAGLLGITEQAAQTVSVNLDTIVYGIPYGIGAACCIRVGHFLGAGEPARAKVSSYMGLLIAMCASAAVAVLFAAGRYQLPQIFTNDPDVSNLVSSVLPVMAIYFFFSGINILGRGVFRGIGWQFRASFIAFLSYYLLALPFAIPMALLTSLGIVGLWCGTAIAITISGIVYFIILNSNLNWSKLSEEAQERATEKHDKQVSDDRRPAKEANTEILNATEQTPLSRSSNSLTTKAMKDADNSVQVEEHATASTKNPKYLILKRCFTVVIFLSIFIAGLTIRIVNSHGGSKSTGLPNNFNTTLYSTELPDNFNTTELPDNFNTSLYSDYRLL